MTQDRARREFETRILIDRPIEAVHKRVQEIARLAEALHRVQVRDSSPLGDTATVSAFIGCGPFRLHLEGSVAVLDADAFLHRTTVAVQLRDRGGRGRVTATGRIALRPVGSGVEMVLRGDVEVSGAIVRATGDALLAHVDTLVHAVFVAVAGDAFATEDDAEELFIDLVALEPERAADDVGDDDLDDFEDDEFDDGDSEDEDEDEDEDDIEVRSNDRVPARVGAPDPVIAGILGVPRGRTVPAPSVVTISARTAVPDGPGDLGDPDDDDDDDERRAPEPEPSQGPRRPAPARWCGSCGAGRRSCRNGRGRGGIRRCLRGPAPLRPSLTRSAPARCPHPMIELMFDSSTVLGLDPGVTRFGYGVIQRRSGETPELVVRSAGVIRTAPSTPLPERLAAIADEIDAIVREFRPGTVAVERVLFQVNVRSAMATGQASGLALVAAARAGIPVVHFSPNEVKAAVAGHGGADKAEMQKMVRALLGLATMPDPPDVADALALALCFHAGAGYAGAVGAAGAGSTRLSEAIAAAESRDRTRRAPRTASA